ncbi:hypothetical protein [Streptomyces sp. NBC_00986]|uniref:hypothetical protein n=1 Tax=Streptomyces sp. NBC_00986 TaxID=2903702 RepID=UPI00386F6235|nr:hypothetical protein OG504_47580 [Streptomyces sp. NBC_00986]
MPALVIVLVLTRIPFALTIWYSLQRRNLLGPGQKDFAGLDNLRAAFGDDMSWGAIKNVGLLRVNRLSEQPVLSIIMITSWRWTPFAMLTLLVGLQALPDDQLKAATSSCRTCGPSSN